jgi:2-iminoacetate synthase
MPSAFLPILDALPARKSPLMERFWSLLEVKTPSQLEAMAREARQITRRNFGRTMRMFAPLYVSNECVNNCSYCGFSRDNASIMRVTLTIDQVVKEARHLVEQGFRNILLVAGLSAMATWRNASARSANSCRRSASRSGRWRLPSTSSW